MKLYRSKGTHDVVNLDISNKCTLACPFCERQSKNFNKQIFKDMTMDEFKFVADKYDVFFCGQISDPIYNKNFKHMLKYLYDNNKDTSVHTAAYRDNEKFYLDLFNAHPKAMWVFGIDGLPNSSFKHRINQKSEKLFNTMIKAKSIGMNVVWQMIVFDYNENQIETCEYTAKELGVGFRLIHSNRFKDANLKPSQNYHVQRSKEIGNRLDPACLKGRELGHSAMGYITPCCWLAEGNVEKKYPDLCNEKTKLSNKDFKEIQITIASFKHMIRTDPNGAPLKCWEKCSNKSTSHKRYIDV